MKASPYFLELHIFSYHYSYSSCDERSGVPRQLVTGRTKVLQVQHGGQAHVAGVQRRLSPAQFPAATDHHRGPKGQGVGQN